METITSGPVRPWADNQQSGKRNSGVTDGYRIEAPTTIHDGKGARSFQKSGRTSKRNRRCSIARTITDPLNQRTRRQSGVRQKSIQRRQPGGDNLSAWIMRLRLSQLPPKHLQRRRCSRHEAIRPVMCAAAPASHKTQTVSRDLPPSLFNASKNSSPCKYDDD